MGKRRHRHNRAKKVKIPTFRYSILQIQLMGERYNIHTLRYGIQTEDEAKAMMEILVNKLGFPPEELELRKYKINSVTYV